jgi:hypothetical protein
VRTTTASGQTYAGAVTLSQSTVLEATAGGAIAFNSTVNGGQALQVNTAGATTFAGAVGGTTPLTALETDNAAAAAGSKGGSAAVNATVRAGTVTLNDATVTLNAAGTTANPSVQTTGGGQTYAAAVTLSQNTVLEDTANGAIVFSSTVNGAQTLQVNTAGATTFDGVVGGTTDLTSLETDNPTAAAGSRGGTTTINGDAAGAGAGAVETTGAQTYHDRVVTADLADFSLIGSTITFNGQISPGDNANVGTLFINGNLVLGGASSYYVTLRRPGGTPTSDLIQLVPQDARTVTLQPGAALLGEAPDTFPNGNFVTIIRNAGAISGTFGAPSVNLDGQVFDISFLPVPPPPGTVPTQSD